jgi:hypothetical protein
MAVAGQLQGVHLVFGFEVSALLHEALGRGQQLAIRRDVQSSIPLCAPAGS